MEPVKETRLKAKCQFCYSGEDAEKGLYTRGVVDSGEVEWTIEIAESKVTKHVGRNLEKPVALVEIPAVEIHIDVVSVRGVVETVREDTEEVVKTEEKTFVVRPEGKERQYEVEFNVRDNERISFHQHYDRLYVKGVEVTDWGKNKTIEVEVEAD